MKIERTSTLTNQFHSREIDVTDEQLNRWRAGEMIQRVMPHLSLSDREFIMTGVTDEEWDEHFKEK